MCVEGVLKEPLLYLSLYFKANRQAYYDHLQAVRETGDWEAWIKFFLSGVIFTENQANETALAILKLFNKDRASIETYDKATTTDLTIHTYFQRHLISNTTKIREACKISLPTVMRSLATLESLGIIKEITGKECHKIFVYQEYLDVLNKGTEPIT